MAGTEPTWMHLSESADALIIASPQALDKLPILNAAKLEFTTGISTAVRQL